MLAPVYGVILIAARPQIISAYMPDTHVIAAAMPLVLIIFFYHLCDALQITTGFFLRAYKVTLVPTEIYGHRALGHWPWRRLYLLGFDVGGAVPKSLQGARGLWIANSLSLGAAGICLFVYWRRIRARHVSRVEA